MSDESRTVTDSMEETKGRHKRYLRAVNNPLRRNILRAIEEGYNTMSDLNKKTQIDKKTLEWHLKILEDGFCIERTGEVNQDTFILTKEGKVVDYLDK